MKHILIKIVCIIVSLSSYLHSAVVVQGNSTNQPYAFTTDITAKTYDEKTGTFFVGLTSSDQDNTYTLSKAARPTFATTPSFSPILSASSTLIDTTIEFLAFSAQTATDLDVLIAVPKASNAFETNTVTALFTDGSNETTSDALNDADGTSASAGIVQIATNENSVFAAVKPNGSFFGDTGTGIALVGIGATNTAITLNIKNATTGLDGNKAVPLNQSSEVLKGTSGGQDVEFISEQTGMYWDNVMQRFFIGLNIASNDDAADIAKAVVVGRVDEGIVKLQAIAPDSAISGGGVDEIIVAQGASITLFPTFIRVMHTSTGPDYLIVDEDDNRIFALPLVNDTDDLTSELNGTLAKKDASLNASFKFVTPATDPGDLEENNAVTNPEAVVGGGNLPMQDSDSISDMVVVGDGVYVSISRAPTDDNDTGIWYSQALFDNTGKILRWTPWVKRIIPLNAFPGITLPGGAQHNGSVKFLQVDAVTGNVWFVEGTTSQTVGITNWTKGESSTDLLKVASAALSRGCYCALDLNQATRGFLNTTAQRYALFGGAEKIVFARTSIATDLSTIASPQTSITNYASVENFLSTLMPKGAGCCQVLEYSRTSTTADEDASRTNFCFFFAGTDKGLFVFTDSDGNGFNPITTSTLNLAPFSNRSWQKINSVQGSITDIKTSGAGKTLYVITSESTSKDPLKSMLLSIPFTSNIHTMFSADNIRTLAKTGVGKFANTIQFYGVQIIATGEPRSSTPENKEQLVLATNQGLFVSKASQAGSNSIATATNQTDAQWTFLAASTTKTTEKTAFFGVAQADTPVGQTVWPFSVQDENGFATFTRGSIHQLSGNGNSDGSKVLFNSFFIPEKFNASSTNSSFKTLFPIIFFFSDGGRRFFIYNPVTNPSTVVQVGILPFDVQTWNVNQPEVLNNPTLDAISRFYWIKQIGATGILMAGTGSGLVGLQ